MPVSTQRACSRSPWSRREDVARFLGQLSVLGRLSGVEATQPTQQRELTQETGSENPERETPPGRTVGDVTVTAGSGLVNKKN